VIVKNIRHHARLFRQLWLLAWRYDVLIEKAVTVKYVNTVSFGKKCTLQSGTYVYGSRRGNQVEIGDFVAVGAGGMLLGEGGLSIGDYTHFGPRVVVTTQYGDSSTDMCQEEAQLKYSPIRIGRGCWIGAGSVIMPGTTLGERCIVAPNSVVYGSWGDDATLVGNPARQRQ
jgi:acetyltransferase-like isoleucine patch superfamily enzyme